MTRKWQGITLAFVLAPFTVGLGLPAGCASGPVERRLQLSDASLGGCNIPDDGGLDRPVALGARLDVRAERGGEERPVEEVVIGDPAVFELLAPATANPVGLRAVGVGQSEVTITTVGGAWADVTLTVAEIVGATVRPDELTIFDVTTQLDEGAGEPLAELVPGGFGLLPDGHIKLQVSLLDAAGATLIGYGAADWQASAGLVTIEAVGDRTDDVEISPAGAATGVETLTTAGGGSFELSLVPTGAATRMALWVPERAAVVETLELEAGASVTLVGLVYDAADRLLLGADDEVFSATLDGAAAEVVAPPWGEPEGDIEVDDEITGILRDGRVAFLKGLQAGTTTLRLAGAGVTLDVPVVVTGE